jgi:hypothetical protein
MSKEKLNIEVELCAHKGRITQIWGAPTSPGLDWLLPDTLLIYIEFDDQPEGIAGMPISIPAKEYSREELLAVFKDEGNKQVAEAIAKRIEEGEEYTLQQQRKEVMNTLAKKAAEILGLGNAEKVTKEPEGFLQRIKNRLIGS